MNFCHHRFISALLWLLRTLILLLLAFPAQQSSAQSAGASGTETIRGMVVNSVSREPISGALVISPDSRFATRTDNQGRFEFTIAKTEPAQTAASGPASAAEATTGSTRYSVRTNASTRTWLNRESPGPPMLSARKPGFLESSNMSAMDLAQKASEVTLFLVPEAVIAGHVSLPAAEAPETIGLQLFRRVVENGLAQWVPAGNTTSNSNGDFRFAELPAGNYKLLTRELLDRDPLNPETHGQQYGYPPVYYRDANDFGSAAEIELSAGETADPNLSLVKQPYYSVKIVLASPPPDDFGVSINVSSQKGHPGPGYALNYNNYTKRIEGMLPNGTYVVEATAFGEKPVAGAATLVVKGAPATDASLQLLPAGSVSFDVKEEFTNKEPEDTATIITSNNSGKARTFTLRGPRSYLNVSLESADELNSGKNAFLRPPAGPDDSALEIHDVLPGRYWVRVQSSYGYAASILSGTTDLLRDPLVVSTGTTPTVEITMRDDSAHVDGQVQGIPPSTSDPARGLPQAFVYCIPTPDSTGQFAAIGVSQDGSFSSQLIVPGEYRLLAFDSRQTDFEYRNPEAVKLYDDKGSVVEVAGGQTEHVTLQLISAGAGAP